MFIRLKNAKENMRGNPLLININSIVSIFEDHVEGGSLFTVIYSNKEMSWIVEEGIEEVYKKIEEALLLMRK